MKIFKPIKRRAKSISSLSNEEDLAQKLIMTLSMIVLLAFISVIGVMFFGPTIGTIFGFLSKNRNDNGSANAIRPNPPILNNLPEATKDKEINISGGSQQGYNIKLFVNGPEAASATTGGDGIFTFEKIRLNDGRNTIFAKAYDSKNIESDVSKTYIITVDTEAPKIEITTPKDGDTVRNLDKRILVSGKLNEKANISINDKMAIIKPDFTFDFLLGVNEGNVEIKIVAIDDAGNKTEKSLKVVYRKSSY